MGGIASIIDNNTKQFENDIKKTLARVTTSQQDRENFDEQNDNATTMQPQRNIVYNVGGDPSFIGANANPVLYYYNKLI